MRDFSNASGIIDRCKFEDVNGKMSQEVWAEDCEECGGTCNYPATEKDPVGREPQYGVDEDGAPYSSCTGDEGPVCEDPEDEIANAKKKVGVDIEGVEDITL